jgi:hypothetical protein
MKNIGEIHVNQLVKIEPALSLDQLAKAIAASYESCLQARDKWIESTKELAGLLYEARKRFPSNQAFSDWLDENRIDLSHQSRAALIKLAEHAEVANGVLEHTERTSWELVWSKEVKPLVEPPRGERPMLRAARNTEDDGPDEPEIIDIEPEPLSPKEVKDRDRVWFLGTAHEAKLMAEELAEYNGPVDDEVRAAAHRTATAWIELANRLDLEAEQKPKPKRGRPVGSKNKPKIKEAAE